MVLPPPPASFCSCPNPPALFTKTRLFLFCSFPSSQILPVKNTGEKMRGRKWRRAKSLRGEGPIKRGPVLSKECAQRWSKMKEVKKRRRKRRKKKNVSLYFLKIDFSRTPRGGLTGRQVGVWIEGGRGLKEEGRLFQTQKQMKESLLAESTVGWRHAAHRRRRIRQNSGV